MQIWEVPQGKGTKVSLSQQLIPSIWDENRYILNLMLSQYSHFCAGSECKHATRHVCTYLKVDWQGTGSWPCDGLKPAQVGSCQVAQGMGKGSRKVVCRMEGGFLGGKGQNGKIWLGRGGISGGGTCHILTLILCPSSPTEASQICASYVDGTDPQNPRWMVVTTWD